MRCRRARRLASASLDRPLAEAERREFEAHLETCDRCRELRQGLRAAWETLSSAPIPGTAPDDFGAIEAQALQRTRGWRSALPEWLAFPWLFRPGRTALATGAALLVALGIAGGWLASARLFAPGGDPGVSAELVALADGFAELPSGLPASGLAELSQEDAGKVR
jgi:anti-sigma factor RsiW